jgi:hypothetical protein
MRVRERVCVLGHSGSREAGRARGSPRRNIQRGSAPRLGKTTLKQSSKVRAGGEKVAEPADTSGSARWPALRRRRDARRRGANSRAMLGEHTRLERDHDSKARRHKRGTGDAHLGLLGCGGLQRRRGVATR